MSIETALVGKLTATAGVTALVGTRIYPPLAPQVMTQDHIVYERVSGSSYHAHDGPGTLAWCRLSYLCYAERYSTAKTVAAAVRAALDGYRGPLTGVTTVGSILSEEDQDLYDDELRRHIVVVDFMVQYSE